MVIMNKKMLTKKVSCLSSLTYSFILYATLLLPIHLHTESLDFEDDFELLIKDFSPEDLTVLRSCSSGEAAAWNTIFSYDNGAIAKTLDPSFYLQTELPRTRNLINYPEWQLCTYQNIDTKDQFTIHFFYNQTSRKNFTKSENDIDGTNINSYINIKNGTFLSLLEATLKSPFIPPSALAPLANLNFPLAFYNLSNAHLEERRLGTMLHFYHEINQKTYFEAKIPFLWMIKNLQLPQKDKQSIQDQFSAYLHTDFDSFDENALARQHIVFDALGFGTMELSLCNRFFERSNWHIEGGAFVFLPTDFAVAKGLYGTYIEPKDQQPILQFCELVNDLNSVPSISPDFNTIMSNYFYAAINQLSSALLQCPLGYYRTLACGLKLSPYWKPHENLEFHGLYTIEFLMPYSQKRFFTPKNKGEFSQIYLNMPGSTDQENDAKLDFFQARLTELLFPRVFETKLFPGIIINSTSSVHKSYKLWDFVLGYNCWIQSGEQFITVSLPDHLKLEDFDLDKSIAQDAYMVKLFGKVHHDVKLARHIMSLTLWADAAIISNTVGNDFTLGVTFDTKF